MIESPGFPRGLWVDLKDETGQALAGIQVEYQGRADSLVVIWSVDPIATSTRPGPPLPGGHFH